MKSELFAHSSILSPLERDVLNIIWPNKRLKVREIHTILKKKGKKVALSSVAVILDRLHEKKIVSRTIEKGRGGLRYTYFPQQDKKGVQRTVIKKTVDQLIPQFGQNAVSYFNERFKEDHPKVKRQ